MAGVEILVTNKVIMSKAAKQSVDAMLAQGKQIRSTSSGAVILKGDGARYHQLVSTAGAKTKLGTYFNRKRGSTCRLGGLIRPKPPFARVTRST